MAVRQNLIQLCEKINGGHYKITPECAEYKLFEQWITDEQIAVMLAMTDMKPSSGHVKSCGKSRISGWWYR